MKKLLMVIAVFLISAIGFAQVANYGKLTYDAPNSSFYFDVPDAQMVIGSNVDEAISSLWDLYGMCKIDGNISTYYTDKENNTFNVYIKTIQTVNGEARIFYALPYGKDGKMNWYIIDSEIVDIVKQLKDFGNF